MPYLAKVLAKALVKKFDKKRRTIMLPEINDVHVSKQSMPWKVMREGYYFKLLRTYAVTGIWVVLFKVEAGASVPPHKHIGAAEYYVLDGKIEIHDGIENGGITAITGDYGYETNRIIHEKTYFPEATEYLFINHGPLQYLDEEGKSILVLDWIGIQAKWDGAEIVG